MLVKRNIERWKPVKGFSGCEISNMGRVRSLNRFIKYRDDRIRYYKGTLRILSRNKKTGYYHTTISNNSNYYTVNIHSLVIDHFGKSRPTRKHQCNHKDGDKSNNWNTNLEWMTAKENINHSIKLGLNKVNGENNHLSKLTEKEVKKIRELYITGKYYQRVLGEMFNTNQTNISDIINYKSWKHVN